MPKILPENTDGRIILPKKMRRIVDFLGKMEYNNSTGHGGGGRERPRHIVFWDYRHFNYRRFNRQGRAVCQEPWADLVGQRLGSVLRVCDLPLWQADHAETI